MVGRIHIEFDRSDFIRRNRLKCRDLYEALGPQPVSNLDPTYHTPPKTKHTCELVATLQVQAGEFHALEHLNVAWGNGVGGGRVRRNGEGSQESSLGDALGPRQLLLLTLH